MTAKPDLILMAEIVGVHGVKGTLKLKVFTDGDLMDYVPLCDASGKKQYDLLSLQQHQNIFLAEFDGIDDRTQGEKLRGTKLYALRDTLPKIKKKNTYYHADLVGMTARHIDGTVLGKVIAVANFGAGDLLDVQPAKGASFYVPFTNDVVPHVDMDKKELTIDPPDGLLN